MGVIWTVLSMVTTSVPGEMLGFSWQMAAFFELEGQGFVPLCWKAGKWVLPRHDLSIVEWLATLRTQTSRSHLTLLQEGWKTGRVKML